MKDRAAKILLTFSSIMLGVSAFVVLVGILRVTGTDDRISQRIESSVASLNESVTTAVQSVPRFEPAPDLPPLQTTQDAMQSLARMQRSKERPTSEPQPISEPVPNEQQFLFVFEGRDALAQRRLFDQVQRAYHAEELEEALQYAATFLERWPDHKTMPRFAGNILTRLGIQAHNEKRYEEAIPYLQQAAAIDPRNPQAVIGLGFSHFHLNQNHAAFEVFWDAAERFPQNGDVWFGLGEVSNREHELVRALDYYQQALALKPGDANIAKRIEQVERDLAIEGNYELLASSHFLISYEPGVGRETANFAQGVLEQAYREFAPIFGLDDAQSVTVVLYTENDFKDAIDAPHWAAGIFDGKIRVPVRSFGGREKLRETLRHELVHAYVAQVTNNNTPTWFNEGLAQYLEPSRINARDHRLFLTAAQGRYLAPLTELEQAFVQIRDPELAGLAYDQSLAVVQYIMQRYPGAAMQRILHRLGTGMSCEDAMTETLGIGYPELLRRVSQEFGG